MVPNIILASNSKQRKLLMDSLNIDYSIIPSNVDEKSIRDDDLNIRARKIASSKAEFVASTLNNGIVIAADTFASSNGQVLEKPQSLEEARMMLRIQSSHINTLYTGFCYIDKTNNYKFLKTAITKYKLRKLSDQEIENFVTTENVLQWSASFCPAYTYQSTLVETINGSFTGMVYGLPSEFLLPCLTKSGVFY